MSYLARLIRSVRARVAKRGDIIVPGRVFGEAIPIERLACPLRYDLRVRIEFIRLLRDQWEHYNRDLAGFLQRPESRTYYVWFRDVRCRHYAPELCRDERRLDAAFTQRVHETARLWEAISRRGYDPRTPIRLASGRTIRVPNGKIVRSTLFAGDGCHRIACLAVSGRTRLEPAEYEVRVRPLLEPLDTTATLIVQLPLDRAAYTGFLAQFYGEGAPVASLDDVRAHVTSRRPELLEELESVLAFDLPRLHDR